MRESGRHAPVAGGAAGLPDSGGGAGDAGRLFAGPGALRTLCRGLDWAATPLGPVPAWRASLRGAAALVLASPAPMVLLWGPGLVQVYNDAYAALMGTKHPSGLGQPTRECWPEVWDFNAPKYRGRHGTGRIVHLHGPAAGDPPPGPAGGGVLHPHLQPRAGPRGDGGRGAGDRRGNHGAGARP